MDTTTTPAKRRTPTRRPLTAAEQDATRALQDWLAAQPRGAASRLAREAGLSPQRICDLRSGRVPITWDIAARLDAATGHALQLREAVEAAQSAEIVRGLAQVREALGVEQAPIT